MIVIHKNPTRLIASFLLTLACLLATSAALAQDPLPVQVTFEFNNVSVPLADGDRKILETEIAGLLAKALRSQFGFWTFQATSSAGAPQLKVQLQKSDNVTISMTLIKANATMVKEWQAEMFKSVDLELRPLPRPNQWPTEVADVFSSRLLIPNQQEILEVLKPTVPVGNESAIITPIPNSGGPLSAVLPLKWDTHQDISECQFLLRFTRQGGGKVAIQSTGLGNSAQYTPDRPQFLGIQVQLERWVQGSIEEPMTAHVSDLQNLTPVEFYLKSEKLPGADPQ
jgi:hypothetical protein